MNLKDRHKYKIKKKSTLNKLIFITVYRLITVVNIT